MLSATNKLLKQTLLMVGLLTCCTQLAFSIDFRDAEETEWRQVKQEDGITVFAQRTQEFGRFKGVGRVKVNDPYVILALLEDNETIPEWLALLTELNELHRDDDVTRYYQGIVSFPILQDREIIFKASITQDPDSREITALLKNQYDYTKVTSQYIRFPIFDGMLKMEVISDTEVEITYELSAYIGGFISADITDFFLVYAPYLTIQDLRESVKNPKYHNREKDISYASF